EWGGGDAPQLGPVEVHGEREEPRREGGVLAPPFERAIRAQEHLLSHLLGAAAVPAEAIGQVHQRPLPPADDPFESRKVAGAHGSNVTPVLVMGQRGSPSRWGRRGGVAPRCCVKE